MANRHTINMAEVDGFVQFLSSGATDEEIRLITSVVSTSKSKDIENLLWRTQSSRLVTKELEELYMYTGLTDIIRNLYQKGLNELAEKIYRSCLRYRTQLSILRMNKVQTENRGKVGEYFKIIKKLVEDQGFKNPIEDIKRLCEIMKQNIDDETNTMRRMFLCDKFITLKAVEIDAMISVFGNVSVDHESFIELESYITSTSNPSLAKAMFHCRQAFVMALSKDFDSSNKLLRLALKAGDSSIPCVEMTDMIYHSVLVKLCEFESNPTRENQQRIMFEANKGMWSLNCEHGDMHTFWRRSFILRMVFCLLGIGKFCTIIYNFQPDKTDLKEAERLLQSAELKEMEHHRRMLFGVCRARFLDLKGLTADALNYIKTASTFGQEGQYIELKAIKEYATVLFNAAEPMQNTLDSDSVSCNSYNSDSISICFNSLEFFR